VRGASGFSLPDNSNYTSAEIDIICHTSPIRPFILFVFSPATPYSQSRSLTYFRPSRLTGPPRHAVTITKQQYLGTFPFRSPSPPLPPPLIVIVPPLSQFEEFQRFLSYPTSLLPGLWFSSAPLSTLSSFFCPRSRPEARTCPFRIRRFLFSLLRALSRER